jgi:hypothetical protein
MRAEINGHTVYLSEDPAPVVSLTINDIFDPGKIRGAKSNTLRIIATKEGRREMGGEYMSEVDLFASGLPVLKMGEDSVNLFKANVAPQARSRNEIECIAVGGNAAWFEFAKATKLREFDYGYTDTRCVERVQPSWTDEDQFDYWPVVNYGGLDIIGSVDNMNPATDFRPALRIHRLIGDALRSQGHKLIPHGTLTKIWKKLVVLAPQENLSNDAYTEEYCSMKQLSFTPPPYPTPELISSGLVGTQAFFQDTDPQGNIIVGGVFVMPFTGTLRVNANGIRYLINGPALAGKRLRFCLNQSGTGVIAGHMSDVILSSDTEVIFNPTFEVDVPSGATLDVGLQIDDDTGIVDGDVDWGNTSTERHLLEWIARPSGTVGFEEAGEWSGWKRLLYASAAPNMTLADLFSELCGILCLAVDTKADGTINVWFEKEFMRKPAHGVRLRDWSTRMDHTVAPIKKTDQNPFRIAYNFKEDKNDTLLVEARQLNKNLGYGNGVHEFAGGIGVKKEEKREFFFAATVNDTVAFDFAIIPTLRKEDLGSGENSYDFAPRIMIADGMQTADWVFNGDSLTEMPCCYFERNDREFKTLGFTGSEFHAADPELPIPDGTLATLHLGMLRRASLPRLEAHMRIWDHELPDFDHGKPTLADDGSGPAWYYVQEIKNHAITKGRPTKTVLVPLPTREADGLIDNPAIEYPPQPEDDVCFGLAAFSDDVVEVDRAVIAQERAAIEAEDIAGMAVSGSGEAAANDTYAPAGTLGGKNAYHTGVLWQCFWFSAKWQITDGIKRYESTEDVLEPWMVVTWTAAGGAATPLPTVVGPTLSLGDTVLIRDHNTITPGSDIWEIHTGDVAEYVGAGNGESGSAWDFTTPAVGTVHKSLEDDTYWIRGFELTTTIYSDNGGTGALCVDYFYPPQVPGGAPPENLAIDPQSYETSVRVTFYGATADQCRTGILEFSGDGGGTWDDHTTGTFPDWSSLPPATVNCGWDIDADTLRIRWERSGHVQGYSQPITI